MHRRYTVRRSAAIATATLLGGVGLVGLTAAPAFAADVTDTDTLNAAIIADDPVITILNDFTLTGDIENIDHDVQIVGNGRTIDADGYDAFDFLAGASANISNLTVLNSGSEAFYFDLETDESAVLTEVSSDDASYGIYAILRDGASLEVTGGAHENIVYSGIYAGDAAGATEVSVTGTTVENADIAIELDDFYGDSTATITNATITDAGYGIYFVADENASLEVTGTDIVAGDNHNSGGSGYGFSPDLSGEASATFDDGTITGDIDGAHFYEGIQTYQNDASSVVVSDSTISGNDYNVYVDVYEPEGSFSLLGSTVTGAEYQGVYLCDIAGTVVISNTLIDGNGIDEQYEGIYLSDVFDGASLTVSNSTISNNGWDGIGGSMYGDGTSLTVVDSTIADNGYVGIFLYLDDSSELTVDSSTFSGNVDGGLWVQFEGDDSSATVTNSTVSGNVPGGDDGWALWAGGNENATFELLHSTVTDNTGVVGVGFYDIAAIISHSIIAGNAITGGSESGELFIGSAETVDVTVEWSLIGEVVDASGAGYTQGAGVTTGVTNPGLAALANNGGSTLTHLPTASSPALNSGNPAITGQPELDQRNFARVAGSAIDIGAVEIEAILPATGADSTGTVWAGGLLLLLGAGILLTARTVRRRAS